MIYLSSREMFIPAVEMKVSVNGLDNALYHSFRMEQWQILPMKRAFMDVLREEHRRIVTTDNAELKDGLEKAQYYTMDVLVQVYPVLAYLEGKDSEIRVGQYCCMFGDQEKSNYIVKVGEAEFKMQDGENVWRKGIYRLSNVKPPECG